MEKTGSQFDMHPAIAPILTKRYSYELSEDDILSLCDLFLTPGLHYATFTSLRDGRRIMQLFVDQLSCYRVLGYVDHATYTNYAPGMNIYELFKHYRDRDKLQAALDEFFLVAFDYDFLWIIHSRYERPRLFNKIFLDSAMSANLDQKIPIICVSAD